MNGKNGVKLPEMQHTIKSYFASIIQQNHIANMYLCNITNMHTDAFIYMLCELYMLAKKKLLSYYFE